ncbi:unnamed protein product, partial [Mesorhabditis belari]|uniref:Uncharacterized protein n=1 Tax=Mesorhabditis belari TaxID=2138241 RepID=A0AAF3EWW6_9BILA
MDLLTFVLYSLVVFAVFLLLRKNWERFEIGDLHRKPIFITGCDSGFGYGLAIKCIANGLPVYAGCRTEEGKKKLLTEAGLYRGKLKAFLIDVTDDKSVDDARRLVEKEANQFGGLHAIVNNAGIVGQSFYDDFLSMDDYRETMEVNLFGVVRVTKAFSPLLRKTRGRIVNMASMCARLGLPGIGPYTIAKHGVSAYSDVIRQELRPWGITVHVLEPGFFKTPLIAEDAIKAQLQRVWDRCSEETRQEYGREFFEKGSEVTNRMVAMVASSNVQWVIDTYFHAITARFPRKRYQIGWDHIFFFLPISILPAAISDKIFELFELFFGAPIPKAVQEGKY